MEQVITSIIEFFKGFSYLGIALALTIEFVPAEIILPMAGFWVEDGEMSYKWVVLAGSIGGTLGPLTLYILGRYGGRPFILRYGRYVFLNEERLLKSDKFFDQYGGLVAFGGRFIPGIRTLVSIPCGVAKMNPLLFSLYTFLATLPMTAVYVYLGYTMSGNWEAIRNVLSYYTYPIGAIALLLVTLTIIFKKGLHKKMLRD